MLNSIHDQEWEEHLGSQKKNSVRKERDRETEREREVERERRGEREGERM